jgi:uncharacterized protein YndB with AHSA1/START domain
VSRSIDKHVAIDAPIDVVWRAITEADELTRWFPVDARVEPGLGGTIWLSWGGGTEGTAPITAWEPERRFGWTESRGPHRLAVDFHIEGRGGATVVRLVQSGFGDGPEWDDEFHMTGGGWSYFLEHLRWYLERHRGRSRDLLSFRDAVPLARGEALARLTRSLGLGGREWVDAVNPGQRFSAVTASGDALAGTVLVASGPTGQLGLTLDDPNHAVLFLEMEPAQGGSRAGFWLSTYGLPPDGLSATRQRFGRLYHAALGA